MSHTINRFYQIKAEEDKLVNLVNPLDTADPLDTDPYRTSSWT